MTQRLKFSKTDPDAYTAMDALDSYTAKTSVEPLLQELIRIRASQINGCAYCVDMHSRDARKAGASEQKVYLVSAWREAASIFTEEERLVFRMTEEISFIHQHGLSDEVYEAAIHTFGEKKTAEIIMIIITINAWNRIGVATHLHPPKAKDI